MNSNYGTKFMVLCNRPAIIILFLCAFCLTCGASGAEPTLSNKITSQYQEYYLNCLAFWNHIASTTENNQVLGDYIAAQYQERLARFQNQKIIRQLSAVALTDLFRAADYAEFFNVHGSIYLNDMSLDLEELEARHIATKSEREHYYGSLIESRRFKDARRYAQSNPGQFPPIPKITARRYISIGTPTYLVIDPRKFDLIRQPADLLKGPHVVIIANPLCHFARTGALQLEKNASLNSILGKYAVWLAPPDRRLYFEDFQHWNKMHPTEKMSIAYSRSEWPLITSWGLPTFYFFDNGRLVDKVTGWPDGGNMRAVEAGLEAIGLVKGLN